MLQDDVDDQPGTSKPAGGGQVTGGGTPPVPPPPPSEPPKGRGPGDGGGDGSSMMSRVTKIVNVTLPLLGPLTMVVVVAGAMYALLAAFFSGRGQTLLAALSGDPYARGAITFVVAVGTVVIALVLLVAVLSGLGGEKAEERFNRGREVLTVFVGLLGTIIGFYFGTTSGESGLADDVTVSSSVGEQGTDFELLAFISGGQGPYQFSLVFEPTAIGADTTGTTSDGFVRRPFRSAGDTTIVYTLQATDAANRVRVVRDTVTASEG